jgi:hypothetical protein
MASSMGCNHRKSYSFCSSVMPIARQTAGFRETASRSRCFPPSHQPTDTLQHFTRWLMSQRINDATTVLTWEQKAPKGPGRSFCTDTVFCAGHAFTGHHSLCWRLVRSRQCGRNYYLGLDEGLPSLQTPRNRIQTRKMKTSQRTECASSARTGKWSPVFYQSRCF